MRKRSRPKSQRVQCLRCKELRYSAYREVDLALEIVALLGDEGIAASYPQVLAYGDRIYRTDPDLFGSCGYVLGCALDDTECWNAIKNTFREMSGSNRKLNPRICRGCGKVFMPRTALQRYGLPECKKTGRWFQCRAVPGAKVNHEESAQ